MKKGIILTLAIVGWGTLILRLYFKIADSDSSPLESMIQFFSAFTILTNLLVTIYCTKQLVLMRQRKKIDQNKPATLTALTVFILIVGIVYHIMLKPIWKPEGLTMLLSEIHHTLIPIGVLLLWIITENKESVEIKKLFKWLIYPIAYISFVLIRGHFSNYYPYPFLNVHALGFEKVMTSALFLFMVMAGSFYIFYFMCKKIK